MALRYYENIILDENIKDYKSFLKRGFSAIDYYALCVSDFNANLMEIISINNVLKDCYKDRNYGIIAIMKGKSAAKGLLVRLVESWLKDNDSLKGFKEYYSSRCR